MSPTRTSGVGREVVRDRFRSAALTAARRSGAGAGAAHLAGHLPRRYVNDAPSALELRRYSGHRLAVLAHFDSAGQVDESFRHLGTSLKAAGYAVVVSTTAPTSPKEVAPLVEDFATAVIVRGNEGFDFQSWRRGVEFARRSQWRFDRLILTNGSMHGPLSSMEHILGKMDPHASWGMTESMDLTRHVQSWWLAFGTGALTHPGFDRYWARVRPARNKWETILAHELRWSDDLALDGPTAAYVSVHDHGCDRNPLFFAWRELIRDWEMPFLKRSLLGPNYDRIDMTGWREFVQEQANGFDVGLIPN